MKVAVLMGGMSRERDVSLASGREVSKALKKSGFEIVEIDAQLDLVDQLNLANPDVAFNALHGRWGEDGCVQGILEWMKIPYTHSGVMASSLAMDKYASKSMYKAAGIPFPDAVMAGRSDIESKHLLEPPYVVKPFNEGSSLGGFYWVKAQEDGFVKFKPEDAEIFLVERYIPGRELTIGVLNDEPMVITEIFVDGLYDYETKYTLDTKKDYSANLPEEIEGKCLEYALGAHRSLGCRGISRTDFRWDESRGIEGIFAIETNSQPGMRPDSNAGIQAREMGMSFERLVERIVEDASIDR